MSLNVCKNSLLSNQKGNYWKTGFTQTVYHSTHIWRVNKVCYIYTRVFSLTWLPLTCAVTHSAPHICYDRPFIGCSNIYKHLYLQLLLLGEAFDSLPSWSLAHKCHDPYQRSMAVQHSCNFLYTLTKRWKDHHTCAHLLCPTIWKCIRNIRKSFLKALWFTV